MHIFGIPIDNLERKEILARIEQFLDEPKFHQIATINPEFLLEAEKNTDFRATLELCDLRIADGFGISLAFLLKGERLKCRFPGADLVKALIHETNGRRMSVYLAIRKDGLSSYAEIRTALLKKYPALQITGADINIENCQPEAGPPWAEKLEIGNSAIILCNFGAPAQELFLSQFKADSSTLRLAIGVGGSFDYLTGKLKRAPGWLRAIGLEWLWRLIQQPQRIKRIWNAVVVFPFRVIFATIGK